MTTWTLWIGALLVVGGSAAQLTHRTAAARALWVLAVLAFIATTVGAAVTAAEFSLPLVLILVAAIAATCALITVTRKPAKAKAKAKAKAAAGRGGAQ